MEMTIFRPQKCGPKYSIRGIETRGGWGWICNFCWAFHEDGEQETVFFSITVVQEHKTVIFDTIYIIFTTDLEQSISQAILSHYADSYHWYETAGEWHIALEVEEKKGLTLPISADM